MKFTREELYQMLETGPVEVEFTKVNGDRRYMICTLNPSYLPEEYREKGVLLTEAEPTIMKVYEIGVGWRAFVIESVISASPQVAAKGPTTLLTE